ncbi:hypothetical protein BU16DRAFT_397740 [Lophium mytilinum]|uniref:Uncharacterized protein n=1 Tax=Lophium mytilinum TaxID=390894 RepID=A0A6A6QVG1_9PEZI|nr:hypothetical protein BU16DRAFT_397740 [Lophium mytilinum]
MSPTSKLSPRLCRGGTLSRAASLFLSHHSPWRHHHSTPPCALSTVSRCTLAFLYCAVTQLGGLPEILRLPRDVAPMLPETATCPNEANVHPRRQHAPQLQGCSRRFLSPEFWQSGPPWAVAGTLAASIPAPGGPGETLETDIAWHAQVSVRSWVNLRSNRPSPVVSLM